MRVFYKILQKITILRFILSNLSLLLLLTPLNIYAWHETGHMLVARVAYNYIDPKILSDLNNLVVNGTDEYPKSDNFITASVWADDIKEHGINFFNNWHYQDIYFSVDGSPIPKVYNYGKALSMLKKNTELLISNKTTDTEKSFALRFVIHIVGDMHQPLHSAARVSQQFPRGDMGGNLFLLTGKYKNIHSLWDSGLATLKKLDRPLDMASSMWIENYADGLMQEYPVSSFNNSLLAAKHKTWQLEGVEIVKNNIYSNIYYNKSPTKQYIANNLKIIRRQLALGGYRLANELNCAFESPKCINKDHLKY